MLYCIFDNSVGQHTNTTPDRRAVVHSEETGIPHGKRLLLALGAVALLVLAAVLFWLFSHQTAAPRPLAKEKLDQAVQGIDMNADFEAAERELTRQLDTAADPKKKADIYVRLASVSLQRKQYAKAAEYQIEAGRADASRKDQLAGSIGDTYMQLGDKKKALPYYRQALDYYESRPDGYSGKQYLIARTRSKIQELEP
jgi:tetratricopeptide (TPR) repeat protein